MMLIKSKYGIIGMVMMMMVMSSLDLSHSTDLLNKEFCKTSFFQPVIEKLISRGVDTVFINQLINNSKTEFNDKFVKINVTGYLGKADYSNQYNEKSIAKSKEFLNDNLALLELAETKYGVPKEVITSVLWVETRHGNYLGNSHIASVYLSTAMCAETTFVNMNIAHLHENFEGTPEELAKLEKKIIERSEKKSKWAIEQLIALEKIEKKSHINTLDLKGSWAGAFGISQFIPSSYLEWAVDGNGNGEVNLFELPDAIFSVANYLKSNGWGNEEVNQKASVYHYNNSNAYVEAVLKLASLIRPEQLPELPKKELIKSAEPEEHAQPGGINY